MTNKSNGTAPHPNTDQKHGPRANSAAPNPARQPTQTRRTLIPSVAQMRKAIAQRDAGFDGLFYYGVITTGVFCLPSCAARTPNAENLRFFTNANLALEAGMRACRRCQPSVSLAERERVIDLARWLVEHPQESQTRAALAEHAGLSPARLQKHFKHLFAMTPARFQQGSRMTHFKAALQRGDAVTEAIYNAGFSSVSRLYENAAMNIGMSPRQYRSGGSGETIYHVLRTTALGELMLAATSRGVCLVQFGEDRSALIAQLKSEFPHADHQLSPAEDSTTLTHWITALDQHLTRSGPRPDLPLDLRGTAFQLQVWQFLLRIPRGEVASYTEVATGIGKPSSVRAAASACGANRIAVLIPCHRVLRGDGNMGGYRWGVARKRALLDQERMRNNSS